MRHRFFWSAPMKTPLAALLPAAQRKRRREGSISRRHSMRLWMRRCPMQALASSLRMWAWMRKGAVTGAGFLSMEFPGIKGQSRRQVKIPQEENSRRHLPEVPVNSVPGCSGKERNTAAGKTGADLRAANSGRKGGGKCRACGKQPGTAHSCRGKSSP